MNADFLRARFDAPEELGVGIEEELFLLDADTLDLTPHAREVLEATDERPALQARDARGAAGDRHAAVPGRGVRDRLARGRPARPRRAPPNRTAG